MRIELVICTYNPNRDFLRRTIEGLKAQSLSVEEWGFLIVDNNSSTPVDASFVNWHPHGRVIVESEPGLTPARICGIRNSDTELIVFVDDDNVLDAQYLEEVLRIASEKLDMGAYGAGKIIPEYSVEPDADCLPFTKGLALRKRDHALWSNDPRDSCNPWGAGLIVRRSVALEFANVMSDDPIRKMLGRKGDSLNSAEDIEFSWIACRQGLGKGVFPSLKMKHLIDSSRVDRAYLARLCEGHAFSHVLMKYLHHDEIKRYSDTLNKQNETELKVGIQRPGVGQKVKYLIAWFLAKIPVLNRNFANVARLASYRGIRRAHKLISECER